MSKYYILTYFFLNVMAWLIVFAHTSISLMVKETTADLSYPVCFSVTLPKGLVPPLLPQSSAGCRKRLCVDVPSLVLMPQDGLPL